MSEGRGRLAHSRVARWLPWIVLALAAALFMGPRIVQKLRAQDQTWERVQREGVLRVGMDASYPPFEVMGGEGQYVGLDVDLARALAERWGVQVVLVDVHLDGLYDALAAGKFDLIISALPYDRTLTRDVAFSESYVNAGHVLLAHRDAEIRAWSNLADRRLGVELGAEAHQLAQQLARDRSVPVEIVALREADDVLAALVEGRVDAVLCDRIRAATYLHSVPGLETAGPPLSDEPFVIAARLDATVLMRAVNEALQAWRADGWLDALEDHWLSAAPR
ncbi:MAG: substrate-binding periplasmic protein [Anaerolineae bacterium]